MAKQNLPSTQSHLDIDDIKENLVILKNRNAALVLETNSLNFELFSEEEQDARILSFASLLNALNFPVQIVVRTQRADMNEYIERLVEKREQHVSKALRKQMEIYIKFVRNLTVKTEVLDKRFLIIIRTYFISTGNTSLFGMFTGGNKSEKKLDLQKAKDYLYPKRNFLIKQFKKMGLKAVQLNNDQLIQLYYDIYDPDKVGISKVEITEKEYTSDVVEPLTTSLIDEVVGGVSGQGEGEEAKK